MKTALNMTQSDASRIPEDELIPSTLKHPRALHFWLAILFTGVATGIGAAILTKLLEVVQHIVWQGSPTDILDAARHATPWRHIVVLLGAAFVTGLGQKLLTQLSSATVLIRLRRSGFMPDVCQRCAPWGAPSYRS